MSIYSYEWLYLSKNQIILSDKYGFCFLTYHNDSSTIPISFIVKFPSTSIARDGISWVTMNKGSFDWIILAFLGSKI